MTSRLAGKDHDRDRERSLHRRALANRIRFFARIVSIIHATRSSSSSAGLAATARARPPPERTRPRLQSILSAPH